MVDLPSSPLADVDPEFERMALETGGLTFSVKGTSVREKLLQNLAQDICRSQLGLAFRMHIIAAKMHDITYADLLAAIRFIAPYAGYPAAADALLRLREVAVDIGMDTSDLGKAPAGAGDVEPADSLGATDEWMIEFLRSRVSRAWSEHRLSARERAIMAITTDVSERALGESFRRHVQRAFDAGLSKEEVRDVVRFCAEHGLARAIAALRELDKVLAQ